jgi:hypothetical protein
MKGKVVSIVKVMNGGQHKTWSGQNGTFYSHTLTVDSNGNQLVGECSTKNTDAAYGPGDEIEFEFTTDQRGNKFKGVKKMDAAGKEKTYGANMDHVARQAAANLAIEMHETFSEPIPDNSVIKTLIGFFHQYIKKTDVREEIYARIAALGMVVNMGKSEKLKGSISHKKKPLELVEMAEKFEAWIISGTELPTKFE